MLETKRSAPCCAVSRQVTYVDPGRRGWRSACRPRAGFLRAGRAERDPRRLPESVLAALVDAGYVRSRRARRDARQRVWLALTPEGHQNYNARVAALHEIVGGADEKDQTARSRHLPGRYGPTPDLAQE
jgi:hypothetical protein